MHRSLLAATSLLLLPSCALFSVPVPNLNRQFDPACRTRAPTEIGTDAVFATIGALAIAGSFIPSSSGATNTGGMIGGVAMLGGFGYSAWTGHERTKQCAAAYDAHAAWRREIEDKRRAEREAAAERLTAQLQKPQKEATAPATGSPSASADAAPAAPVVASVAPQPPLYADPSWRSAEGFQTARWGMTRAEIARSFAVQQKPTPPYEGISYAEQRIAGFPGIVFFIFSDNRLARVVVNFQGFSKSEERCAKLEQALRSKYGDPVKEDDDGIGVSKSVLWQSPETRVGLACELTQTAIAYFSVPMIGLPTDLDVARERDADRAADDL